MHKSRIQSTLSTMLKSAALLVLSLLQCTSARPACPPGTPASFLPDICFNPTGTDCNWYVQCLDGKDNCGVEGYALKYGLTFCTIYQKYLPRFSPQGQTWVNAVRKCLQTSLVPLLEKCDNTCGLAELTAISSHTKCYVTPAPATPSVSICNLSCVDLNSVKNVVLNSGSPTPPGTFEQILSVFWKCPRVVCGAWGK